MRSIRRLLPSSNTVVHYCFDLNLAVESVLGRIDEGAGKRPGQVFVF
jgi:hypothetical protein